MLAKNPELQHIGGTKEDRPLTYILKSFTHNGERLKLVSISYRNGMLHLGYKSKSYIHDVSFPIGRK